MRYELNLKYISVKNLIKKCLSCNKLLTFTLQTFDILVNLHPFALVVCVTIFVKLLGTIWHYLSLFGTIWYHSATFGNTSLQFGTI